MQCIMHGLPNYRRLPQTNSNVWESYLEDGKLPQTIFTYHLHLICKIAHWNLFK